MSDSPQGAGWWQASDGKWYPPQGQAPLPPGSAGGRSGCAVAAIVVAVAFGALVVIAILSILAITLLGRSTSDKLSNLGDEIESGAPALVSP